MAGTTRWTAILGVRTRTPRSADSLRRNPLGIYIDAIDWTRELEPTETSPAPPAPAIISFGSPRSEEHTSELQSLMRISYAVFCLKKKQNNINTTTIQQETATK